MEKAWRTTSPDLQGTVRYRFDTRSGQSKYKIEEEIVGLSSQYENVEQAVDTEGKRRREITPMKGIFFQYVFKAKLEKVSIWAIAKKPISLENHCIAVEPPGEASDNRCSRNSGRFCSAAKPESGCSMTGYSTTCREERPTESENVLSFWDFEETFARKCSWGAHRITRPSSTEKENRWVKAGPPDEVKFRPELPQFSGETLQLSSEKRRSDCVVRALQNLRRDVLKREAWFDKLPRFSNEDQEELESFGLQAARKELPDPVFDERNGRLVTTFPGWQHSQHYGLDDDKLITPSKRNGKRPLTAQSQSSAPTTPNGAMLNGNAATTPSTPLDDGCFAESFVHWVEAKSQHQDGEGLVKPSTSAASSLSNTDTTTLPNVTITTAIESLIRDSQILRRDASPLSTKGENRCVKVGPPDECSAG
ncbi:unnamed protein product [Caenorhabditis auriculariae]|uniref:Uncharacterized protein n=1 Tax=Caenorhabditis auriculariae TaxID=2777116 RepID=A0A8S1GZK3_9PELO|nr:unnamed protein product [Caenorhabditis auriculariae]